LTVNVPVLKPSSTVATVGIAEATLPAMAIVMPPAGAAALSVTVPAAALPPTTLVGSSLMPITAGALMVKTALIIVPETEITTVVSFGTGVVPTVNVPVLFPPGTVHSTTVAAGLLLTIWNVMPLAGAEEPKVSVPVDAVPPVTAVGLSAMPVAKGGLIVSVVSIAVPVADIVAVVMVPTGVV